MTAHSTAGNIVFVPGATTADDLLFGSIDSLNIGSGGTAISFTGFAAPVELSNLVQPALSASDQREPFWRELLAGSTHIALSGDADNNIVTGDFVRVANGETAYGANDVFSATAQEDDNILIGDAYLIESGATLFGGDDQILIDIPTPASFTPVSVDELFGDAGTQFADFGHTVGGDDVLSVTGYFDRIDGIYGELGTNHGGVVEGGNDRIIVGEAGVAGPPMMSIGTITGDILNSGGASGGAVDTTFTGGDDIIDIFNLNGSVSTLVGDLTFAEADTETRGGSDVINVLFDLPLTSTAQMTALDFVAGDGQTVVSSLSVVGGDDVVRIEGIPAQTNGDYGEVLQSSLYTGGDDMLTVAFDRGPNFAGEIYGEGRTYVTPTGLLSTFRGGNDTIRLELGPTTVIDNGLFSGDVLDAVYEDGMYFGGDDVIDLRSSNPGQPPVPSSVNIYGDFRSLTQSGVFGVTVNPGADTIFGGNEDDTIFGDFDFTSGLIGVNPGGDDVIDGGGGNDVINGGPGNDTAVFGGDAPVFVRLYGFNTGLMTPFHAIGQGQDRLLSIENVTGSDFNDVLTGDDAVNVLRGGIGDDILEGDNDGDMLFGEGGNDTLAYSADTAGVDVRLFNGSASGGHATGDTYSGIENVTGGSGGDYLVGNSGVNILRGGGGGDQLRGGSGDDMLFGQAGMDRLEGGAGDDFLEGGADGDVLIGGQGSDSINYADDTANLDIRLFNGSASGGSATGDSYSQVENVFGGSGDDYLAGNSAANMLRGRGGDDVLIGGSADDMLEGGTGADVMDGGAGTGDTASYMFSALGVNVRLFNNSAANGDAAGDVISNFENLIGSMANDYLAGDDVANELTGLAGNDQVRGGGGDDVLRGGDGVDFYLGAGGADWNVFDTALGFVDNISGFSIADADRVVLDDAIFDALATFGTVLGTQLSSSEFVVGAAATTANHRIIYNDLAGGLFYDPDGTGAMALDAVRQHHGGPGAYQCRVPGDLILGWRRSAKAVMLLRERDRRR